MENKVCMIFHNHDCWFESKFQCHMLVVMDTQEAEAGDWQAHCHPGQEQTLSKIKKGKYLVHWLFLLLEKYIVSMWWEMLLWLYWREKEEIEDFSQMYIINICAAQSCLEMLMLVDVM